MSLNVRCTDDNIEHHVVSKYDVMLGDNPSYITARGCEIFLSMKTPVRMFRNISVLRIATLVLKMGG